MDSRFRHIKVALGYSYYYRKKEHLELTNMILRAQLLKRTILVLTFVLTAMVTHAQYATMDFVNSRTNEYEAVLGGNADLQYAMNETMKVTKRDAFYDNGNKAFQITCLAGTEQGIARFYHENGQLAMSGKFVNGKMVGLWKFFTAEGHIPTGEWKWKSKDGFQIEGQLVYGKPYGEWSYTTSKGLQTLVFK